MLFFAVLTVSPMNIVILLFNLSGMDDVSWLHRNDDGNSEHLDGWQELGNL